jgi:hypothetical protein
MLPLLWAAVLTATGSGVSTIDHREGYPKYAVALLVAVHCRVRVQAAILGMRFSVNRHSIAESCVWKAPPV